jgi:hypothetical protein
MTSDAIGLALGKLKRRDRMRMRWSSRKEWFLEKDKEWRLALFAVWVVGTLLAGAAIFGLLNTGMSDFSITALSLLIVALLVSVMSALTVVVLAEER